MKRFGNIAVVLSMFIVLSSLAGCGGKKDTVFTLNGMSVSKKDVDIYGFIYSMEHSIVDDENLMDVYENGETYAEHYKNDLEEDIILAVLLNKEADENKVALTLDDKNEADANAGKLLERFGEGRLKEMGISKGDVKKIYEVKIHGNNYAKTLGNGDTEEEAGENDRYVKVYQVTFPTVVCDESGMLQTDKDGKLKTLSDEEIDNMKQAAEEFAGNAKDGEDIESLLKEDSSDASGVEKVLKYDDISDEYKEKISGLKVGEISDVITGEYGYYVVKMLEPDDDKHATIINDYEIANSNREERNKLFDRLFESYVGADKDYRNDEIWTGISINDYVH